jgi:cell division protein FtsZ
VGSGDDVTKDDTMTTPRKPSKPEITSDAAPTKFRLKVIGVGGAGGNAIRQLAGLTTLVGAELIAVNTDLQALGAVADGERLQIGAGVTRGLGAGGDIELGMRAAQQDGERIEAALQNTDVVFLVTGLGGGTGTGASPIIARLAKEQGALVLGIALLPFTFEGERRRQQALVGLEQLKAQADAVICLPNDKLFKIAGENASAVEAFQRGNEAVATGVQAIWQLLSRRGLINLDFAALRGTLGTAGRGARHSDGLFSHGEAEGPDRARDAVKALLENPLFDGGDVLAKAEGVLVSIAGGTDLTLAEVQRAVEPISKIAVRAHVIMGAALDESLGGKLTVTIIAATNIAPRRSMSVTATRGVAPNLARPGETSIYRNPKVVAPVPQEAAAPVRKEPEKPRQETLPLAEVSRGRFDKSEPTLYDGEDLDMPTFLRKGISLKK